MSTWKTAAEWAAEGLKGLPGTERGVQFLAQREDWSALGPDRARRRKGRGGGWEYHVSCLPAEAQAEHARRAEAKAHQVQAAEARAVPAPQSLDARRRQIMEARAALILEIERRAILSGSSFSRAVTEFLAEAKAGMLPEPAAATALRAVEKSRGTYPSPRAIAYWRGAYKEGGVHALAPEKRAQETKVGVPEWLPVFLRFYASPTKPTMAHALERMAKEHPAIAPSYDQVRRALTGLKGTENHLAAFKGREGPLALKARLAFTTRSVEGLDPTTIYTADGKTFDAEIAHPIHGRPFRPEITTIVDVATRKIVGWSVDLAENTMTVADALRHACVSHGIPAIFYTDRGPGYRNKALDDQAIGLAARLGITTTHSLPYNSQARGIIERVNGSVWNKAAKELVTYIGADMDREAKQRVHKATRKDLKELGESPILPSFEAFIQLVEEHVADYNAAPHSSLKIRDAATGRMRKASPAEKWAEFEAAGFEVFPVAEAEADELFRPHVRRRANRDRVDWIGNQYSHNALEAWHGMDVLVGYDIHDARQVWVRELEMIDGEEQPGKLICVANFWNHVSDYMPKSFVQHAKEKRVAGQVKRLGEKQDRALEDLRAPMLEQTAEVPLEPLPEPVSERVVPFVKPAEAVSRRNPRNPSADPDIDLAWSIVDSPIGTPIPPHHVALLRDLLGNLGMVQMMRDVQLPLAALDARLEAAAIPLQSSNGR